MRPFPSTHEEFLQAVQNHLKERPDCPIMIVVHSHGGLEVQCNFVDYALQFRMLDLAKMTTALAFNQQAQEGFRNGENKVMVSNIADAINPKKKMPN